MIRNKLRGLSLLYLLLLLLDSLNESCIAATTVRDSIRVTSGTSDTEYFRVDNTNSTLAVPLYSTSSITGTVFDSGYGLFELRVADNVTTGLLAPSAWATFNGKLDPFGNQTANYVYAGPASGSASLPTFRAIVDADIPSAIARDAELPVGANPTASVNGTVVNGSAVTFMRSDAAPSIANPLTPSGGTLYLSGHLVTTGALSISGAVLADSFGSGQGSYELQDATASVTGFLTAANWTTFNNKQATLPTATTGTVLRGNGSSWVASTSTFADTYPVSSIPYASSANTISALGGATVNALLVTGNTAIPAFSTDIPIAATIGAKYIYRADGNDVPLTDGGTNASLTASNGGIVYSNSTAFGILSGTATAGQIIRSGASTTPAWSTATYPTTITAFALPVATGTNVIGELAVGATGKLLMGATGAVPVWSTPTFPNVSATSGKVIKSDGTNWVASTETYAVPSTSGNLMKSDGTNWTSAASTELQWDGGATNLVVATGRTSLGLGTADSPQFANLVITGGGDIRPSANSTASLNIAQADGTDYVTFDSTDKQMGINVTPTADLHVKAPSSADHNLFTVTASDGKNILNLVNYANNGYLFDLMYNSVIGVRFYNTYNYFTQKTMFGSSASAARNLEALDASNPQLRLSQAAASKYTDFQTNSGGDLTITPSGGKVGIGDDTPDFTLETVGTLGVSSAAANDGDRLTVNATNFTVNDVGADVDFRIESDTDADALTVDGGTGAVGVGGALNVGAFVTSTGFRGSQASQNGSSLLLTSTYNGVDNVSWNSYMQNSTPATVLFAGISFTNTGARTAGFEKGAIKFSVVSNGAWDTRAILDDTGSWDNLKTIGQVKIPNLGYDGSSSYVVGWTGTWPASSYLTYSALCPLVFAITADNKITSGSSNVGLQGPLFPMQVGKRREKESVVTLSGAKSNVLEIRESSQEKSFVSINSLKLVVNDKTFVAPKVSGSYAIEGAYYTLVKGNALRLEFATKVEDSDVASFKATGYYEVDEDATGFTALIGTIGKQDQVIDDLKATIQVQQDKFVADLKVVSDKVDTLMAVRVR